MCPNVGQAVMCQDIRKQVNRDMGNDRSGIRHDPFKGLALLAILGVSCVLRSSEHQVLVSVV